MLGFLLHHHRWSQGRGLLWWDPTLYPGLQEGPYKVSRYLTLLAPQCHVHQGQTRLPALPFALHRVPHVCPPCCLISTHPMRCVVGTSAQQEHSHADVSWAIPPRGKKSNARLFFARRTSPLASLLLNCFLICLFLSEDFPSVLKGPAAGSKLWLGNEFQLYHLTLSGYAKGL